MSNSEITIYSDGACLGNPGPGGYGAVLLWGSKRKELSEGFRMTTNNRMEILAVIKALQAISTKKRYNIRIFSDSRLVVDAFNKGWLTKWSENNWKRNKKDKVLNPDLWKLLLEETSKHNVSFQWVEAHAGIPENERCDELGKEAAMSSELGIDEGYEDEGGEKLFTV